MAAATLPSGSGVLRTRPGPDLFHSICVNVRRQDSVNQIVHLDDAFYEFVKTNFPHYNELMVTVPVSFQYKNVKTHGIVSHDGDRKGGEKSKDEMDWLKAVSGQRAEQRIFDEIQRKLVHKPCLLTACHSLEIPQK